MSHANGVRAVLFDLDGTLRHNQPNGYQTFVGYLEELGYSLSEAQVMAGHRWTHYYWSVAKELQDDLREFGGENRNFWARLNERQLKAVGLEGDLPALAERLQRLFDERYLPDNFIPEDVIPTLQRLQSLGYTVGLVSNRQEPLESVVSELGLGDFFVFTLSAGQAQCFKPAAAIFHQAVQLAGCTPEATIYVGDNYYADVQGALAAGLRPVLIDPYGIFPDPGCPVIRSLSELEGVLASLGTKPPARASQ